MANTNIKGIWLPIDILINSELNDKEKIILSLILFFSKERRCCDIKNEQLSELVLVTEDRISRLISLLKDKGYIEVKYNYKEGGKKIITRVITPLADKIGCYNDLMGICENTNKNIDKSRTYLNYHLKEPKQSYEKEFERIRKGHDLKGQIKDVSNIACEYIITSGKEFFEQIGEEETKRYFKTAYDFVCEYKDLGEQNILSAVVHMDEKTPHMHLVFIPVVHTLNKQGQEIDKIACSEF